MSWITENMTWIFSGAGIAIPLAILGWWFASRVKNGQSQKSGDNSTNIQVGGNLNIDSQKRDE